MSDDWTTVGASKKQASRERNRQNRVEYLKFCRTVWPKQCEEYLARAKTLYERFQRQETGETEESYARRVEAAILNARHKHADCGRSVEECENKCSRKAQCDHNRRVAYEAYKASKTEEDQIAAVRAAMGDA